MIAIGTLCLLINGHELEGRTCVVDGPLEFARILDSYGRASMEFVHGIAIDVPVPPPSLGWAARPRELLPIAPPGNIDEVIRERVRELRNEHLDRAALTQFLR